MRYETIRRQRALTDAEIRERYGYFFGDDRDDEAMLASLRVSHGEGYTRTEVSTDDEATARAAFERLRSGGDPTVTAELRIIDVTPVHVGDRWCLWSDGRVSRGIITWQPSREMTLNPLRTLSRDAARLISEVVSSDSGDPSCGWAALARVREITGREVERLPQRVRQGNPPAIEHLTVDTDEGPRELWLWCCPEGEDYQLEVATTRAEVEALAIERTVEDDAGRLVGVVDVSPEERGAACVRLALGRDPTSKEAAGAWTLWASEWARCTAKKGR